MEVTYIDHMGSDLTVVNAARVSFHKESSYIYYDDDGEVIDFPQPWETDNYDNFDLSSQDQKLIKYLASHNHFTPFTHVQITMREKVPIFVARQRFKHMVGFTYNEVSRRYVDDAPEFFVPDAWRKRAEDKKQGSSDEIVEFLTYNRFEGINRETPTELAERFHGIALKFYNELLINDIAPEQARMILPQSMYTTYYCTGSLAAWARAYKLRIDPHAQKEIQDLAKMWNDVITGIPELKYSWKALTNA